MATYKSLPEVDIINEADNNTNIIIEQNGELNRLNISNLNVNNSIIVTSSNMASGDIYNWTLNINGVLYEKYGEYNKMCADTSFEEIYDLILQMKNNTPVSYNSNTSNSLIYIYYPPSIGSSEVELYFPLFNFSISNEKKNYIAEPT